ncbi:ribosomal protein S6 kinase delta-1 [Megalops cyprinoides]|uniref:ribosomal protein S6 kinase delta-1 n=1 Tax=Megalops cyprinoides TaxID=118141 RepID=UPI001864A425|nr:ribosomal protein S6 kinase delta-1 [Megalops cyprinoides]
MISQRERGELARFYTVTDPKKHQKGYTVYKVTARIISRKNPEDVQEITVWKRYSDFRKLHRDLWQIHKNLCHQSELFPPFAKAKVFGRFDDTVIEERRQCSEDLLQFSANIPALYSSQHIEDFFKGGEVHDGSELIGPPEPLSDFLTDSLSDCSSEVHKDIGGVDDLTAASQSEYGGLSSDSDLISLRVDTDSLADLDDGMASGGSSPNKQAGGRSPSPHVPREDGPSAPDLEAGRASRAALFAGSLKPRAGKKDYLERAGEQIKLAVQKEGEQDYQAAFSYYRSGVDLLLQGVQGEPSPTRREAVKKKTAEYLMRAEQISSQYLRDMLDTGPLQTVAPGPQGSRPSWSQRSPAEELKVFRVLGVIDKVLLVLDKRTQETFILKGLRKSSECGRNKKTIIPHCVPNMVRLHRYIVSEDSIFLVLQHAEGGKLWSHVSKFLNRSPEESFDIPFIQKSHTAAVHTAERAEPQGASSSSMESGPEQEGLAPGGLPLKSSLTPSSQDEEEGPDSSHGPLPDSGATSEEECTNSYLTLCNEYEQEKMEPDSLEEGPLLSAGQGPSSATEDPPSPRSHSLLSNDSLCSPITAQELRFFTEEDPGEVFSPTRLSVDSLDQSKKTPMEFFRIDSKDSASEVLCPEPGDKPKFDPSKSFYPAPEPEPATKGHKVDLWGLDSDRASNESVPVISFKEAVVEDTGSCDEGRPPDLLVNLPGVADALSEELVSTGPSSAGEAKASPKFGKPDVLQLHHAAEDPAALALSPENTGLPSAFADPLNDDLLDTLDASLGDCRDLTLGLEATELDAHTEFPQELPGVPASLTLTASSGSDALFANSEETARPGHRLSAAAESVLRLIPDAEGTELKTESLSVEESKPDKDISQLFRDLDERLLMAAQAHIPEEYVQRWAVEIIVALDALHQQGIVCRDLNPNNILLNDRGHIQLTYFCSWSEAEDPCDREAVTHMYCAPEVGSICEETAACDWWSLGAILFELLTGKSLYQCHPAGISRHTSLNVPDFVSEEAKSLLQQLLQFNPIERLGAGVAGVEDIKSHPFFARVVWPK